MLLWLARKPVAERALAGWCAERGLECDAKFTELGTRGVTLSSLKVGSGGKIAADAAEVRAGLRWKELFTPEVTGVTVNGLSLRGTMDQSGIHFGGLERLVQPGTGTGTAPRVDIRDARLLLDTPSGQIAATVNVKGALPRDGAVTVRLDPGKVGSSGAQARIEEGRLDARIENGLIEAELGLKIQEGTFTDFRTSGLDLIARAEFEMDASRPAGFEWSMRAAGLAMPDLEAEGFSSSGRFEFRSWPGFTADVALNQVTTAMLLAEARSVRVAGRDIESPRLEGELTGVAGEVSGPLVMTTAAISTPEGYAEALTFSGEVVSRPRETVAFDGALSVRGASLSRDIRQRAGAAFVFPGVLQGHADALRSALDRGLSAFDATLGVGLEQRGRKFILSGTGDSAIEAASGLSLRIRSVEGQPWLAIDSGDISARGNVALSGGGGPSASLALRQFAMSPDALTFAADTVILSDWTVGGRMISAAMSDVRMNSEAAALEFAGKGEFEFAGEAAGVTFAPTRITGGLDGSRSEEGWRVQAASAPCLAVDTDGLALGTIALAPAHLDICPVNGRFMRQGPKPGGAAVMGDVRLPFTLESGSGELNLTDAAIDWTLDGKFTLSVDAETLSLPLMLGERTLSIDSAAPGIEIVTGKGPAAIEAHLGATVFGGTMVPAKVSAREFVFDGVSAPTGIEGAVSASGVQIKDLNEDEIYEPILADFNGTLSDRQLAFTGPLALQASGITIADARLDMDIISLNGAANVTTRNIVFREGGLQPYMISDRLTGLFTRATGRIDGTADFTIRSGKIEGVADGKVRDFGFQTTQLGRVSGFSGNIEFDDLMALTTPPGQEFTLASVNPGIPLSNGRITFGLERGVILKLEDVTFPFGGGTLAIAPFDWDLDKGFESQIVEVNAQGIELDRLVEILKLPDTRASGTVSGVFPIAFSGSSVSIRDARLRADDPGGNLSYTGGAAGAAAEQDSSANLAFEALRDLRFNVLEIAINGDLAGQMQANLLIAGRNVNALPMGPRLTLPAGQAFEFNIGFDVPLGKLLEENLGVLTQEDLIDATRDLLEQEKSNGTKPE
ncbi:MAG TPA: YdbH domain-containing protein [Hyphomonas sp.]|nr:YdbH domain-containing protein [Hyphomonas sp.]